MEPTIVHATAGSGKTRYLSEVCNELVGEGVFPIACTYLNSMKDQLASRVHPLVRVSTLHSLAGHVINSYGREWTQPGKDEPWSEPYKRVLRTAAKLVEDDPEEIEPLVMQHEYLLIDEAQDLTQELYWFARALGLAGMKLIVVGDEDQSIFEFNGGSSDYMHALKEEFQLKEHVLDRNYRCFQEVVDLANMYTGKEAKSSKGSGAFIKVIGPVSKWEAYKYTKYYEGYTTLSFWRYCFPDTGMWNADLHHTVHSYKGSQAEDVLLIWDPQAIRRLCQGNVRVAKKLINVALTRSENNLVIVRVPGDTALEIPLKRYYA